MKFIDSFMYYPSIQRLSTKNVTQRCSGDIWTMNLWFRALYTPLSLVW